MVRQLSINSGRFIFLILLQVLVLNNIQFSGLVNPYLYVLFILLLPFEVPGWALLFLGFLSGFSIDIFSDTLGLHTSATVILAFLRPFILRIIAPRDGYDSGKSPGLHVFGLPWFLRYSIILIFVHHFFLFFFEVFRFSDIFHTFFRIILSSIFTILLVLLSQFFFYKKRNDGKMIFGV